MLSPSPTRSYDPPCCHACPPTLVHTPKPVVHMPQILQRAAPTPSAADSIPPLRRITRSLTRSQGAALHPPLSAVHKLSPFYWHQAVSVGPPFLTDQFGLPLVKPGYKIPQWVRQRRRQLRRLPQAQLNQLLTGDPASRYDPVPYEDSSHLWIPPTTPPQPNDPQPPPDQDSPSASAASSDIESESPRPNALPLHRRLRRCPSPLDGLGDLPGTNTPPSWIPIALRTQLYRLAVGFDPPGGTNQPPPLVSLHLQPPCPLVVHML